MNKNGHNTNLKEAQKFQNNAHAISRKNPKQKILNTSYFFKKISSLA
jgi:hypothetical protein